MESSYIKCKLIFPFPKNYKNYETSIRRFRLIVFHRSSRVDILETGNTTGLFHGKLRINTFPFHGIIVSHYEHPQHFIKTLFFLSFPSLFHPICNEHAIKTYYLRRKNGRERENKHSLREEHHAT